MSAAQIIEIDETGNQFKLNEAELAEVLGKVPPGMKVSIVAVAGAFRTGKSFLLDLFLRYLRATPQQAAGQEWMVAGGKYLEGNVNPLPAKLASAGGVVRAKAAEGFAWRGGHERNTTGIWMWKEPYYRTLPGPKGEQVAVLLMDTQGMFDSRLTQMLTACIFGLSTLISSHQIYNVQNRIQEDNLQHLALFTEYGRVAHSRQVTAAAEPEPESDDEFADATSKDKTPVFQRLEFLVRDWQEYEGLDDEDLVGEIAGMSSYLNEVLETEGREHKDLRDVRDHIHDCFEAVGAFLLPHPGFDVIAKDFDGDIEKIRQPFRTLLQAYVTRTFGEGLLPKKVDGRYIDAPELLHLIKAYVGTFHEANALPEARTLLAATSEANNLNAKEAAFRSYKEHMDSFVGSGYLSAPSLVSENGLAQASARQKFDIIATIGAADDVKMHRAKLDEDMAEKYSEYCNANKDRDPFKNLEFYAIPLGIGISSFILRVFLDILCFAPKTVEFDMEFADLCASLSHFLADLYHLVMLVGFAAVVYKTNGAWNRVKDIFGFVRHTVASGDSATAMATVMASRTALERTASELRQTVSAGGRVKED